MMNTSRSVSRTRGVLVAAGILAMTSTFSLTPCSAKPVIQPPSPPDDFVCPPGNVVSSAEELDHHCAYGEWFVSEPTIAGAASDYACYDWEGNKLCEGIVDESIDVPTCHQPTISDCSNKDEYFSVCAFEDHAIVKGQTNCNVQQGTFSCWDKIDNRWCQGTIEMSAKSGESEPSSATTEMATTTTTSTTTAQLLDESSGEVEIESSSTEASSFSCTGYVVFGAMVVGLAVGLMTSRPQAANGSDKTAQYVELESTENSVV